VLDGKGQHAVGQRRHKDGHLIDVEAFGVPFIVDGELRGQCGLYSDISHRIKAEKARSYFGRSVLLPWSASSWTMGKATVCLSTSAGWK
jgi:hypothetical protein